MVKDQSLFKTISIVIVVTVITTVLTIWAVNSYFFPKSFTPVVLSQKEQKRLDEKISFFQSPVLRLKEKKKPAAGEALTPERYTEVGASREIEFTERELNAVIATNTDLADKLAVDLSRDMASAKLIVPLDPDFPFLGGKTLKVSAGLELRYTGKKPVVILRGVSVFGVPMPDAWLGNLKNVDLVKEFGGKPGFWKSFSDGVENISIDDGVVKLKLKE